MRKFIIFTLVFLLLALNTTMVFGANKPEVAAEGAIVMDVDSKEVIYDKNIDTKYYPASTTKIMTALITLEKCKLDDKVVVGKRPPFEDGSKIYLFEGEIITVKDLLYALLLNSANDAALALAEHISGSKEDFAKLMNERAKEIGCTNTNFTNPHGLFDENHYTTAHDLALIAYTALQNPIFNEIIKTHSYTIEPTNKQPEKRILFTQNRLLYHPKYKYNGADGVKTGYTTKSKHTFVGSATRDNRRLLVVVLNSQTKVWTDVQKLFDYGFTEYKNVRILSKDESINTVNINHSDENIIAHPEKDLVVTLPKDANPVINKSIVLDRTFDELKIGDQIGYIKVEVNNKTYTVPLLSKINYTNSIYKLKPTNDGSYQRKIRWKAVILYTLGLFILLFLIRGFYRKYKRRRL